MGYPKGLLSEGEQIILHKHPHFKMLIWPVLAGLIIVAAGAWFAMLASDVEPPWDMVLLIAIGAVGLVLLIWLVFAPFVRWRTTHFIVTTDRVIAREGVIKRTGIDIPMRRINSVRFEHNLLDRIFGTGTLIIESASEEPLQFDDIPGVEKVHTWIYRQLNDNPYDDFGADEGDYRGGQGPHGTKGIQQLPHDPRQGR